MRPEPWNPPIDLSEKETKIVKLIKRAKLFTFLREIRHLLLDEKFQEELSTMYAEAPTGHPPVPPAQLASVVILQAYTKASDAEAIEALTMDKRWQLVLNCLDCEQAPFSQATLVRFRQALIIHQLDRRLIERTIELALKTKKFGGRQLRGALDSSPLWGAAKVEDVELDEQGSVKLEKGVAKHRRITIEDPEMRHGRKNRSKRFDGYKRHILKDLDNGMVRAVGVTMANLAEASVTEALSVDLEHQKVQLSELHIDRAYLSSSWVKNRDPELTIYCKAWRVTNGNKFAKSSFILDWESGRITCPNQVSLPFREGGKVQFPAATCANCSLRSKCTTSKRGRSVSIHPDEKFIAELRERQLTTLGRAKLRERVAVEHSLSHIGRWQGDKARYLGVRKNLFDLRRTAVVHNLHVLLRLFQDDPKQLPSKARLA